MAVGICIFADRDRGLLMDDGTSLYPLEGQDILLLLSWVYLHMPMILYINCFDLKTYLEHKDDRKYNFREALCVLCYMIAHS